MKVIDLLQQFNIPYKEHGEHHHTASGWVQIDCPWCSEDWGHFRLGIHLTWPRAHCWTCGGHGLVETIRALTGLPWDKCRELTGGIDREFVGGTPRGKLILPNGVGPLKRAHTKYLKSRGFDPDEISKLWGVMGIGQGSSLPWRLFIPVHLNGEVVSWTTRSLTNDGLRYISAGSNEEALPAKHLLYGADLCSNSVVVHEGPTDVWRTGPGAVATLGVSFSTAQLKRLSRFVLRVICFDGEPPAQQRALRLQRDLGVFPGETINVVLTTGKDPASCEGWEIRKLRRMLK
jgi:hypothetical protein